MALARAIALPVETVPPGPLTTVTPVKQATGAVEPQVPVAVEAPV